MRKISILIISLTVSCIFFVSCKKNNSTPSIAVDAGLFKTIQLPADSATLTGTVTSGQSTASIYSWTLIAGPNTPVIANSHSTTTKVTNLISGTYIFQFEATNSNGTVIGLDTTGVVVLEKATTSLTTTQILVQHSPWEIEDEDWDNSGTLTKYIRGVTNTTGFNQDTCRLTFNTDGTGTNQDQYGNVYDMTWSFTSADETNMHLNVAIGSGTSFDWGLVGISDSALLETSVIVGGGLISTKWIPVP